MIIILKRKWWAFWRRPFRGLNPFAWYELSEIEAKTDGDISIVSGGSKPNDGCGGEFVLVSATTDETMEGITAPEMPDQIKWMRPNESSKDIEWFGK